MAGFFKGKAVLAAMVLLFPFKFAVVFSSHGSVAKSENAFAITAILAKWVNVALATGTSSVDKLLHDLIFI